MTSPDINLLGAIIPDRTMHHRSDAQEREVIGIKIDADAVEGLFAERGLHLPRAYGIFTAGFNPPLNSEQIGVYGEGAFKGFPEPDIYGHDGTVSVAGIGQKDNTLILKGRAHPNEWVGEEYGSMMVAHPLQVIKELIRRQRARDGVNPIVVLTYLTGVREDHAMPTGGLGVIIDDSELANAVHSGYGPRGVLDQYVGDHFQPKAGRSSHLETVRNFVNFARGVGNTKIYPVVVCGTPGTPEYQSYLEVGMLDNAFDQVRQNPGMIAMLDHTFGEEGEKLSLLYGMGITAELATMRQTFPNEDDFSVLALGLATDLVGGKQSLVVNHQAVVGTAFAAGEGHRDTVVNFLRHAVSSGLTAYTANGQDYSISAKLT